MDEEDPCGVLMEIHYALLPRNVVVYKMRSIAHFSPLVWHYAARVPLPTPPQQCAGVLKETHCLVFPTMWYRAKGDPLLTAPQQCGSHGGAVSSLLHATPPPPPQ